MIQKILSLAVLACLLFARPLKAESVQGSIFLEAVQNYTQGHFEKALEEFLDIKKSGFESAQINYNIGNCYFKLGKIGRSILFYEKAHLLSKRDPEIQSNLQLARNQLKDKLETPVRNIFWVPFSWMESFLNFWEWGLLNVILGWLFLILTAVRIFLMGRGSKLNFWIYSLGLLQMLALTTLYLSYQENRNTGIIIENEVQVQSGPGESFPESFKIHEGSKISILETQADWSKITLPNGWTGWMKSEGCELI